MTNLGITGRQREEGGFTLIELIVVIVVLGILVATAVPKYLSVTKDARIAALNGIAAGINGSLVMVNAKSKLAPPVGGILTDAATGLTITVVAGGVTTTDYFPTGDTNGIVKAFTTASTNSGAATASGSYIYYPINGGNTTETAGGGCNVVYKQPTATADAVVTINTGAC